MTLLTLLSAQAAPPPPPQEAFATGGFLPNDRRERDRRGKAIRATMERVLAPPVVARAAETIREAVAPKPAPEVVQDARFAVTLGQVDALRAKLDAVRARAEARAAFEAAALAAAAAEEDEEDVLMLLGAM